MSFRLDIKGTIILTVVIIASSYVVRMLFPTMYCIIMPIIFIVVLVAGNWQWLRHQFGGGGG